MSTAIAFLSGKGGSGKTTLSLSMADLLCRCDMHILLVDCDLSTNGASYFYESQLTAQNKNEQLKVLSFVDLINTTDYLDDRSPLEIKSALDFIPSIPEISGQYLVTEQTSQDSDKSFFLSKFIDWARDNYDVMLFDCQAGYTEILPMLLPLMDIDLFVLEADSISASAMRSLHLKIGNYLGRARLYQIFNKATLEEFEIYSKIVGTFFTNIGTLQFDWKIRQAFSRSQIPDLENTSAKYGLDLCTICKIILTDKASQEKLGRFSAQQRYKQLVEKRKKTEEELYKLEVKQRPEVKPKLVGSIYFIIGIIGMFLSIVLSTNDIIFPFGLSTNTVFAILIFVGVIILFAQHLVNVSMESRTMRQKYERKLRDINKELEKMDYSRKKI